MHSLTSSSADSISSVNWDRGQGQYVQPPFHCPLLMESAKKLGLVFGHCREDQSLTVLCLKALLPSQALEMPDLSWHGHSLSLQLSMQGEQAETLFLMWNSNKLMGMSDRSIPAALQGMKELDAQSHPGKTPGNLCFAQCLGNSHFWIQHMGRHCRAGWHKGSCNKLLTPTHAAERGSRQRWVLCKQKSYQGESRARIQLHMLNTSSWIYFIGPETLFR